MALRQEAFCEVHSLFQLQNSRLKRVDLTEPGMKVIDVGLESRISRAATLQPASEGTHDGPEDDHRGRERRDDDEQDDRRPTVIQKNQVGIELRANRLRY